MSSLPSAWQHAGNTAGLATMPSVTQPRLAELVQVIDRRLEAFERGLNRLLLLPRAQVLTLVLLALVVGRVG